MLTQQGCLSRQERFRQCLASLELDAAVVTDYRDVYYLTGMLPPETLPACLLFKSDGGTCLIGPALDTTPAVDDYMTYDWNEAGTNHFDMTNRLATAVAQRLSSAGINSRGPLRRVGWQVEAMPHTIAQVMERVLAPDNWVPIDPHLAGIQRRKDPDEIAEIREAIRVNTAAYDAVQEAIAPGVTELDVLSAGWRGAVRAAGEHVYHNGDYRCGAYNGPARPRPIESGEMYIVDAWTRFHGYWSDLARTYIVGPAATDLQESIFDCIAKVQRTVAAMLRPGLDTKDVWRAMDELIREHPALADIGLTHHGGHGIGLRIHSPPDINRNRGEPLQAGDCLCLEPGGYTSQARCGARIENMYLMTEDGAENLSDYPVELRPRRA